MTRRSAGRLALGLVVLLQGCAGLTQGRGGLTTPAGVPPGEGAFEVVKGRPGIVIGAPHGTSDEGTAVIARDLAGLTGFGLVVATGLSTREAETEGARRMDEAYRRRVAEAAQGPLHLYVEVQGNGHGESAGRLEIATIGLDRTDAWRLKTLFELIRDARVDDPSILRLDVWVESLDQLRATAGAPRQSGLLVAAPRTLEIELPRPARTTYRQVYTELLGAFLNESAPFLLSQER